MRRIFCTACGTIKPTHPEDAALGLFSRYVRGTVLGHIVCDQCDKPLTPLDEAVAVSQPADMGAWEHEYMIVTGGQPEARA